MDLKEDISKLESVNSSPVKAAYSSKPVKAPSKSLALDTVESTVVENLDCVSKITEDCLLNKTEASSNETGNHLASESHSKKTQKLEQNTSDSVPQNELELSKIIHHITGDFLKDMSTNKELLKGIEAVNSIKVIPCENQNLGKVSELSSESTESSPLIKSKSSSNEVDNHWASGSQFIENERLESDDCNSFPQDKSEFSIISNFLKNMSNNKELLKGIDMLNSMKVIPKENENLGEVSDSSPKSENASLINFEHSSNEANNHWTSAKQSLENEKLESNVCDSLPQDKPEFSIFSGFLKDISNNKELLNGIDVLNSIKVTPKENENLGEVSNSNLTSTKKSSLIKTEYLSKEADKHLTSLESEKLEPNAYDSFPEDKSELSNINSNFSKDMSNNKELLKDVDIVNGLKVWPIEAENLVEASDSNLKSIENSSSVKSESISNETDNQALESRTPENVKLELNACDSSSQDKSVISETLKFISNNSEKENSVDDDFEDLSAIEIATDLIKKMESPEMAKNFKMSDTCENIMNACSSTAQALKQTISDVLKSRENIVITASDTTTELEANLSKKIADFENIVGGCYYVENDIKTDLTNIKHPAFSNVIITEVNEPSKDSNSSNFKKEDSVEKKIRSDEILPSSSEHASLKSSQKKADDKISETNKDSSHKKNNSKETKNIKQLQTQPETAQVNSLEDDKNFKKQQKTYAGKKKGEKTVDQILKSLSNYSTSEEKLQALCKKHLETLEELRMFEPRIKQLERQVLTQQREKEQQQAELNRMILAKSRLESLCRELQRQNRAVKEESLMHIKAEEERRKEIANKFQTTLSDISTLMQEHSKRNIQLREENAELAKKLKALVDHYDMWEKHMEKIMQQNNLETQLAKAKHAKVNLLLKQETEKFLKEKHSMLESMSELQKKCTLLTTNELKLRNELEDYTAKYDEFQTVLNKSSQVFATFKNDMDATSKKIKKLEKETNVYKQKWENSNKALLAMISEKDKHDQELAHANAKLSTLQRLCRALQAERNELRKQINVLSGSTESSTKDVPSQLDETPVA